MVHARYTLYGEGVKSKKKRGRRSKGHERESEKIREARKSEVIHAHYFAVLFCGSCSQPA